MTFPNFVGATQDPSRLSMSSINDESIRSVRILVTHAPDHPGSFILQPSKENALTGVTDGQTLYLTYTGTAAADSPNPAQPISVTDVGTVKGMKLRNWAYAIPLTREVSPNANGLFFTIYIFPYSDIDLVRQYGNIVVTLNEASVASNTVALSHTLMPPFGLSIGKTSLRMWKQSALPIKTSVFADNHHLIFADQRTVPMKDDSGPSYREHRCLEDWLQSIYSLGAWALERFFGADSACVSFPTTTPNPQINIPMVQPLPNVDLTVYEATQIDSGDKTDFDAAMGITFCNDGAASANADFEGELAQACTLNDRQALAAIGELSTHTLRALISETDIYNNAAQSSPLHLSTGNAQLDAWLNQDIDRTTNALNAAASINAVSDAQQQPSQPINLRRRKARVVKASCAENKAPTPTDDAQSQAWQCVQKAKQKMRITEPRIAIKPAVQAGRQFALRNTPQFDALARQVLNSGVSLPPGIRPAEFSQLTAAIAYDGASSQNLGTIYLNDPTDRASNTRFNYGLMHIWAPGQGGGNNAGHREDWSQLPGFSVNTPALLTNVLMAAVIDDSAQFIQTREKNGNIVRTYQRFTYRNGGVWYEFSNIRMVFGQNGMIITAYPLKQGKAQRINNEM